MHSQPGFRRCQAARDSGRRAKRDRYHAAWLGERSVPNRIRLPTDSTQGTWGGTGTKKAPPKPHFIKKIAGVDPTTRADYKKTHVIISEKRDKKAAKYQVKDLPFPYTSKAQFDRSMEVPLGTEWNTRLGFQRATLPKVVTKVRFAGSVSVLVWRFAHSEHYRWASSLHHWKSMHDHGLACLCRTFRHSLSTSSIRTAYCRTPIHVSLDSVIRTSNNVNNAFIAHFYNTSRRAGANTYSSDVCEASNVVCIIHMRAGPIEYAMVARRAPSSPEEPYCLCSTLDPLQGAELRSLTLGPRVDPETHVACASVGAQSSPSASPTMA